jgi:hypothetical protein
LALNELEAETWKEVELRLLSSFDTLKVKDKKDRGTITIKVTKYGIIVVYFLVFFFFTFYSTSTTAGDNWIIFMSVLLFLDSVYESQA